MRARYSFFTSHAIGVRDLFVKWLFLLLFPVLLVPNVADADNHPKKILVIHSYHQGLVWTDDIMEGIYSVFKRDNPDVDIHVEYMDTKRHFDGFDGNYLNSLLKVYRNKYGAMRFDVIISSDDNALRFLLMHHKELFPGTPIIFCGVNDYTDGMLSGHEGITGVLEFLDQQASMDIALKLHPESEQVFIVTDTSTTGKANRLLIQELAAQYRDRAEFVFLDKDNSGLTQQELLDRLKRLPEKSIVYYSDFLRNREGYIDQETAVPMITSTSRRPVYTHYDEILGLGVVGGKLVNGHSQGRKAAGIARKVMQGTPVSDIPVYKESINSYMFDYLQLKRFGIAESWLPGNSVVINKPYSLYESHKKTVWAVSGFVGSLLALIVFLNINIARRISAEKGLKEAHDELEQRVEERTNELSVSNRMLEEENSERKRAESEIYAIYNAISDLITVQGTDYRILSYNKTVEETFGKGLKGKLCYEVYQGRKAICPDCAVKKAIETKKLASTLLLELEPPSAPSVEIYAYPILDEKGEVAAVVEHGRDVSERMQMLETIKESEKQLKASLGEKEVLLKEIHHRVKNNMAIVSSLLHLQSEYVKDKKLNRILSESRNRIASMALVHEKLYQTQDFITINFKGYIEELTRYLLHTYGKKESDINLALSIDDAYLNIDTMIPLGLVINELVTNSLKHAFEGVERPEISISFNVYNDHFAMVYSDNGRGLPEHIDFSNSRTLGLQIVNMLILQLKGTVELDKEKRNKFTLKFENPEQKK
jgi:two-component sensor histidine kinase/ABC-type uncharacterized transport system substrate-binding protein